MVPGTGEGKPASGNARQTYRYPTATGEVHVTEVQQENAFFEQQRESVARTGRMESPAPLKEAIDEFYQGLEAEREAERRIPRIADDDEDEVLG